MTNEFNEFVKVDNEEKDKGELKMRAEEIRKIMQKSKDISSDQFWEETKDKLFEAIIKQAKLNHDYINISKGDALSMTSTNKCWLKNSLLIDKLMKELKLLGYEVFCSELYGKIEYITISW